MAVRRGYFGIDSYPFSQTIGTLRFEEILRVHTKTGKVWDFRPGHSDAIGLWAVTEDDVEWTLYHLPALSPKKLRSGHQFQQAVDEGAGFPR
jgi:hypothetical protein